MTQRHTAEHIETWRREGGVKIEGFFTPEEVAAVAADFEIIFPREVIGDEARVDVSGPVKKFNGEQFAALQSLPLPCSPALNLIGVHPALIALAKDALGVDQVHNYQYQAWAKFTGEADYDQPFHCDFVNHTLTAPSDEVAENSITILCYFNDLTDAHGPMHYVKRTDSAKIVGPEGTLEKSQDFQDDIQIRLAQFEQTSAGPAGTIFPYAIDTYHRGTNLTAPGGYRYAVMSCFRAARNDGIGYTAWPFDFWRPWSILFENATPEQLACFGVRLPGDPFWTETTLARTQKRYPGWNSAPYRAALETRSAA